MQSNNAVKLLCRALGKLAEYVESDDKENIVSFFSGDIHTILFNMMLCQKAFKEMIPGMVNVLEQCLKEGDEESASEIFEVFDTLLMLVRSNIILMFSRTLLKR